MALDPEARAALVRSLRQAKEEDTLTPGHIEEAAASAGCSKRTIRRWISHGPPTNKRSRYAAREADLRAYAECNGSLRIAHARRLALDPTTPSYPTFRRAILRELSIQERAFLSSGSDGRRRYGLHARWEVDHRNFRWELDTCELKTLVTVPGRPKPERPLLTAIIDCATRAVMGSRISIDSVTTADLLVVLHSALTVDAARGPFGGAPGILVHDLALAHLGGGMTDALLALNIVSDATDPYAPTQKGKIERVFGTFKTSFLKGLPFYGEAPRNAANARYQPSGPPLPLGRFVPEFAQQIDDYNLRRNHRSLGCTPLERWEQDTNDLRLFPPQELAFLLTEREERVVQNTGINFRTHVFIAPELAGLVGERVEVRYRRHDLRSVEVFHEGSYVCRAEARDLRDEQQAVRIAQARVEHNKRSTDLRRKATRAQRTRVATMTEAGPPTILDLTTPGVDAGDGSDALDRALARRTDAGLLDFLDQNPKRTSGDG